VRLAPGAASTPTILDAGAWRRRRACPKRIERRQACQRLDVGLLSSFPSSTPNLSSSLACVLLNSKSTLPGDHVIIPRAMRPADEVILRISRPVPLRPSRQGILHDRYSTFDCRSLDRSTLICSTLIRCNRDHRGLCAANFSWSSSIAAFFSSLFTLSSFLSSIPDDQPEPQKKAAIGRLRSFSPGLGRPAKGLNGGFTISSMPLSRPHPSPRERKGPTFTFIDYTNKALCSAESRASACPLLAAGLVRD